MDRWSSAGHIMAWVIVGEVILALVAITDPDLHGPGVLVGAAGVMTASAVIAARTRMPVHLKALLIAGLCSALLSLAAAYDPFGLRAVDRSIADAARQADRIDAPTEAASEPVTASAVSTRLALRGTGDPAAAAFADDLARNVAGRIAHDPGAVRIDGIVDVTAGTNGDTYRLTWTLGTPDETRWCGRIVASGQARSAVLESFGKTLTTAWRRSRTGPMTCG